MFQPLITTAPPASSRERTALLVILGLGLMARVWNLTAGVPYAVGIDEPAIVDRSLRILHTGSWNTQPYDYPSLVIYLHALVGIARFLLGAIRGEWASLDGFDVAAVYATMRLVTALVGTATVWLVWRVGRELHSPAVGLIAAAQLAFLSMHVRESHFVLTDVPVTALAVLCLWLTVRARRIETVSAYALAGVTAGLTAAAKYNGGIVLVAPLLAWLLDARGTASAARKLGAIVGGAALAFVAAAPFTVLDLPGFLDGFAAQMSRFARPRDYGEPLWRIYLKHLAQQAAFWLPAAAVGLSAVVVQRRLRRSWLPVVAFGLAYFYVLSTHSPVFARYALPIVPVVCLFAAVAVSELARLAYRAAPRRYARDGTVIAAGTAMALWFAAGTVQWLRTLEARDTRSAAAEWLAANVDRGTRIAVENAGPTYLASAGFDVVPIGRASDRPVSRYIESRIAYVVVAASDVGRYSDFLASGTLVFEIAPTAQRAGPPLRIIRLTPPPQS